MGDLFHKDVGYDEIRNVLDVIYRIRHHKYIILTKRPRRALRVLVEDLKSRQPYSLASWAQSDLPLHLYVGVTTENQKRFDERWHYLKQVPAAGYFISHEPALGPLILPDDFLSFGKRTGVITGGESGPGARPMHPGWPMGARDQCVEAGVPFMFKQWGGWAEFVDNGPLPNNCNYVGVDGSVRIGDFEDDKDVCMGRVGKKAAGRLLDGKAWNQLPWT